MAPLSKGAADFCFWAGARPRNSDISNSYSQLQTVTATYSQSQPVAERDTALYAAWNNAGRFLTQSASLSVAVDLAIGPIGFMLTEKKNTLFDPGGCMRSPF